MRCKVGCTISCSSESGNVGSVRFFVLSVLVMLGRYRSLLARAATHCGTPCTIHMRPTDAHITHSAPWSISTYFQKPAKRTPTCRCSGLREGFVMASALGGLPCQGSPAEFRRRVRCLHCGTRGVLFDQSIRGTSNPRPQA